MAQARRARDNSNGFAISQGGKRAKNVTDHYNGISNKRRFIAFLVCFALVVLFTGLAMVNSFSKLSTLNDKKAQLQDQKEDLLLTQDKLTDEVEYTNTKEFVEYMARKLLGWINPSDKKYIIID